MKTVARTFLLLFLCSLQGKAAFYSDKAANLLNTLDSLIENYPQVIEQRQYRFGTRICQCQYCHCPTDG